MDAKNAINRMMKLLNYGHPEFRNLRFGDPEQVKIINAMNSGCLYCDRCFTLMTHLDFDCIGHVHAKCEDWRQGVWLPGAKIESEWLELMSEDYRDMWVASTRNLP